jgi:hypothetical protein
MRILETIIGEPSLHPDHFDNSFIDVHFLFGEEEDVPLGRVSSRLFLKESDKTLTIEDLFTKAVSEGHKQVGLVNSLLNS